jgi:hypothetical protein
MRKNFGNKSLSNKAINDLIAVIFINLSNQV